ncbi:MAG: SRPBCC family protein [Myxococcaceae bacterium]|nr:SRPBCC family protein [Myxococcaceae bacterium]
MLKKILLGLVAAIVAFAGFVSTRPSTFTVQRSATLQAPPDYAFALVNDFHQWEQWSPWSKLDPNQKATFDGPSSGVGAKFSWSGNDQVGEGRMTIEESKPNELVRIKLEFLKPWEATNTTTFAFQSTDNGGVSVTWKMEGNNDFMGKAFSLFMDMDGMVGKDFEKGLASMKEAAEARAKKVAEEKALAEKAAAEAAAAAAAAAPAPTEGAPADGTATAPAP